jgi:hypothetical protein
VAGGAEQRRFGLGHELGRTERHKRSGAAAQNDQQYQHFPVELFQETHRFATFSEGFLPKGLTIAMVPMRKGPFVAWKRPTMNVGPEDVMVNYIAGLDR